ncbi:hypothetical protein P0082_07685 [Candidatus Haliotispira prima]|uniref:Uncharacterized protein n=1 Tax=Candidatus Haliotispira prima TaxID=3034016 RepID=A0ABY8MEE9_9SPIO|nr:hypothetical protein P0082_07685 [Candidatus Haliotispira prima]
MKTFQPTGPIETGERNVVLHDACCTDVGSTKAGEILGFVFEPSTSDDF